PATHSASAVERESAGDSSPAPAAAGDPPEVPADSTWRLMPATATPSPAAREPVTDAVADTDSWPTVPVADRPTAPPSGSATDGSAAADTPADTGSFQPAVPSAVPYEFPSTGSVRLLPPAGRGAGTRSGGAGASSPARFRTAT